MTSEISWQAPDRPYRKRGMRFYFNLGLIAVIVFLILVFFQQYVLVGVLFSLVFVGIVLNTVAPRMITYEIKDDGIDVANYYYPWAVLGDWYLSPMYGRNVLVIAHKKRLPRHLHLQLDTAKEQQIVEALQKHLKKTEAPQKTWFDRRADDLARLINIGEPK